MGKHQYGRAIRFQRVGLHKSVPDLHISMCSKGALEEEISAYVKPYLRETAPLIVEAHPDVREGRAYIHKGGEELVLVEFTVHLPEELPTVERFLDDYRIDGSRTPVDRASAVEVLTTQYGLDTDTASERLDQADARRKAAR
ncbi:hypothetical protein [Marinactinospora rubrisoli]|uniref:Uncharacterized protein n=1 Tax=Marinactinospora rubrisoli TaxID=2715399 RepID=A0ABW2KN73_9ACTN